MRPSEALVGNAEQIIEDLGVGKPRVVRHTCKQFLDVDLIHWQIHFSSLLFFFVIMTKIKVAHAHLFVNMNQQIATNIFLFGKYPVYNAIRIAYCAIRIELNFLCGSYII